jgi:hypothetical protein
MSLASRGRGCGLVPTGARSTALLVGRVTLHVTVRVTPRVENRRVLEVDP